MKKIIKRFCLNPTDRDIIRALMSTKLKTTPSSIARSINVHPVTAQRRIEELKKLDLVKCKPRGNRTYCSVNMSKLKRKLKNDFFGR